MANWFTRYAGPGGGSGMGSWDRAINDGYTPQQIAAAVDGSGLTVGWRLRDAADAVNAGIRAEEQAKRQVIQTEANLRNKYEGQLNDFRRRVDDYKNQVQSLTGQYEGALKQSQEFQQKAADFEDQFNKRTVEFEAARQEADRYREEAVGQQLRAIRSGATSSGNQRGIGIGTDLQGGAPRFSDDREGSSSTLADLAKAEGGLTDSVLSRKGPVVERIQGRQGGTRGRTNNPLSSGSGTNSYYASRFR